MSVNIKSLINALFKLSGWQAMPQSQYTETTSKQYVATEVCHG